MLNNDLIVIQKAYDCYLYLHVALKHFPKAEKFVLSADIKNTFFEMLKLFLIANKAQYKKKYLYEADVQLDLLRFRVKTAYDLKFLPPRKFEIISKMLSEIGRLLGGWIKSSK